MCTACAEKPCRVQGFETDGVDQQIKSPLVSSPLVSSPLVDDTCEVSSRRVVWGHLCLRATTHCSGFARPPLPRARRLAHGTLGVASPRVALPRAHPRHPWLPRQAPSHSRARAPPRLRPNRSVSSKIDRDLLVTFHRVEVLLECAHDVDPACSGSQHMRAVVQSLGGGATYPQRFRRKKAAASSCTSLGWLLPILSSMAMPCSPPPPGSKIRISGAPTNRPSFFSRAIDAPSSAR